MMVSAHINYPTFEDPAPVNLVRRALTLASAGDLYGAAEAAAAAPVPFAFMRVVCDEATPNVPPLVMPAINPDDSTNWKNILRGVFFEPLEVFDLVKVGFNMKKSFKVLDQAAEQLGSQKPEV